MKGLLPLLWINYRSSKEIQIVDNQSGSTVSWKPCRISFFATPPKQKNEHKLIN
jgi:hypothetical protein